MELVFGAGCKDTHATYVSVGQDRKPKKGEGPIRRNFVLAIAGDTVVQVATRPSTYSGFWMEWADEGSYGVVAMTDVDGDGSSDLVWADHEHEGGDITSSTNLFVRFANGTSTSVGHVKNLVDVQIVAGQLVVAGQARGDERMIYACVGRDLRFARCRLRWRCSALPTSAMPRAGSQGWPRPPIASSQPRGSPRSVRRRRPQ